MAQLRPAVMSFPYGERPVCVGDLQVGDLQVYADLAKEGWGLAGYPRDNLWSRHGPLIHSVLKLFIIKRLTACQEAKLFGFEHRVFVSFAFRSPLLTL